MQLHPYTLLVTVLLFFKTKRAVHSEGCEDAGKKK